MDLVERAKYFIKHGHPTGQLALLLDCVSAQNAEGLFAVQLMARDMYGGDTFNLLLKAPAAYCLLAWGQGGLKALVDNALREPTSKNFGLAFELLAGTAEGTEPQPIGLHRLDSQLREVISRAVGDWAALAGPARANLNELMLSIDDDDDAALYAGISLQGLAVLNQSAIRHLSHALASRSMAVGPRVLTVYDRLLADRSDDEPTFHRFFESHPLLLDSRAFQVWSKPDLHGQLEPDFLIRTYDDRYLVVEIETPAKLLVTQQYQLSAQATHAISQVLLYQEFLRTHLTAATAVFPKFSAPDGLVVIGRESTLNAGQQAVLRLENLSRSAITIVGFDALAHTARTVTDNVVDGISGAISGTRL